MVFHSLLTSFVLLSSPTGATLTLKPVMTVLGVRPIALAAGPSGSRFAASLENATIRLYDVVNMKVIRVFSGHPQPAYAVAFNPKGTLLASGDESARIFIWDVKSGKKLREMRTHLRGIQALSFDSTGKRLLSTGKDDFVRLYDVATGKELRFVPGKGANFYSAAFMAGGSFAVATLGDGVRVYGPSGVAKKYMGHDDGAVWDFDFLAKANRLVTGGRDGVTIVWDLKAAKKLRSLRGHADWVNHVRMTPNGRYAFTASTDRTVRIWNLKTLSSEGTLQNMSSIGSPLCVTANGQYIVAVNLDDFLQVLSITPRQG